MRNVWFCYAESASDLQSCDLRRMSGLQSVSEDDILEGGREEWYLEMRSIQ